MTRTNNPLNGKLLLVDGTPRETIPVFMSIEGH